MIAQKYHFGGDLTPSSENQEYAPTDWSLGKFSPVAQLGGTLAAGVVLVLASPTLATVPIPGAVLRGDSVPGLGIAAWPESDFADFNLEALMSATTAYAQEQGIELDSLIRSASRHFGANHPAPHSGPIDEQTVRLLVENDLDTFGQSDS